MSKESRDKYSFNVNMYTIEKDGEFFAYLNVVDAYRIVNELNRLNKENTSFKKSLFDNEDVSWKYSNRFFHAPMTGRRSPPCIVDRKSTKEYYHLEQLPSVLNEFDNELTALCKAYEITRIKLIDADRKIERYERQFKKMEEIIDNRLDNNVVPKWEDNTELFVEEKVGYRYALRQLRKKLKREDILYHDKSFEELE